jgi:hypothetical protein
VDSSQQWFKSPGSNFTSIVTRHHKLYHTTYNEYCMMLPLFFNHVQCIVCRVIHMFHFYMGILLVVMWSKDWLTLVNLKYVIFVSTVLLLRMVDSSYHIQITVSIRRGIIWGISVHNIHKEEVLFSKTIKVYEVM